MTDNEHRSLEAASTGEPAVPDTFEITVSKAIDKAREFGIRLSPEQAKKFLAAALEIHRKTVAEVSVEALRKLPTAAPKLFAACFNALRDEHRARFLKTHGRKPFPNNDREDYTPVHFLHNVYGPFVNAGVITGKYLEDVDPPLYRALIDFVRGSNERRAGRRPTTMEEIGVRSHRDLTRRLRLAAAQNG